MVLMLKKRRRASVSDIADALRLSIKATSKHLGILAAADILEREQESLSVYYSLSPEMPAEIRTLITSL